MTEHIGVNYSQYYAVSVNAKLHEVLANIDPEQLGNVVVVDSLPQEAPMLKMNSHPMVVVPKHKGMPRNREERRRLKYDKKKRG